MPSKHTSSLYIYIHIWQESNFSIYWNLGAMVLISSSSFFSLSLAVVLMSRDESALSRVVKNKQITCRLLAISREMKSDHSPEDDDSGWTERHESLVSELGPSSPIKRTVSNRIILECLDARTSTLASPFNILPFHFVVRVEFAFPIFRNACKLYDLLVK